MRIYISGAITGKWDYLERFDKKEKYLQAQGHSVVNPDKIDLIMPEGTTYDQYMTVSMALLSTCEAIYMMSGWEDSNGARKEFSKAIESEMTLFIEEKKSEGK